MPLDAVDEAQSITETFLDKSLKKSRETLTLPFSGKCLCCDEPVGNKRFCDTDCRVSHEAFLKRRMIDPATKR